MSNFNWKIFVLSLLFAFCLLSFATVHCIFANAAPSPEMFVDQFALALSQLLPGASSLSTLFNIPQVGIGYGRTVVIEPIYPTNYGYVVDRRSTYKGLDIISGTINSYSSGPLFPSYDAFSWNTFGVVEPVLNFFPWSTGPPVPMASQVSNWQLFPDTARYEIYIPGTYNHY